MIFPAVYPEQKGITIVLFGVFFGLLALILFLMRKRVTSKWRTVLFWIFLVIFLLFSVQLEGTICSEDYSKKHVCFKGVTPFPHIITSLFEK